VQDVEHVVEDRLEVVGRGPLEEGEEDLAGAHVLVEDLVDDRRRSVPQRAMPARAARSSDALAVRIHSSVIFGSTRPAKFDTKTLRNRSGRRSS